MCCIPYLCSGILYINPADLGWNPPVSSWIERREVQSEKANLTILFDKYLPSCLDGLRSRYRSAHHLHRSNSILTVMFSLARSTGRNCVKVAMLTQSKQGLDAILPSIVQDHLPPSTPPSLLLKGQTATTEGRGRKTDRRNIWFSF